MVTDEERNAAEMLVCDPGGSRELAGARALTSPFSGVASMMQKTFLFFLSFPVLVVWI